MRLRSGSTETDGSRFNFGLDNKVGSSRSIGGRLQRFFRGSRSSPSATDGPLSSPEEEPPEEILTVKDYLEMQRFSKASQLLIDQEEDLFMSSNETMPLQDWESEVNQLQTDHLALETGIFETIRLSLNPGEVSVKALTSAVTALCREEAQDTLWAQREQAQKPQWRPSKLKDKHDKELRLLVEERMDNPTQPLNSAEQGSSIQSDLWSMGQQLKDDLETLVEQVKDCYPESMDICNVYAALYHQTFSTRLRKIAEFGLDDKDSTFLLRWVNEFYPQILQKQILAESINSEALGKLLPEMLLKPLEEQYLSKHQSEMETYIRKVLEEAKKLWTEGEMPKTEDGYFVSEMAYDIIQFINGAVTSAQTVLADQHKAQSITSHLQDLLQSYKSFQEEVMRSNKPNSVPAIKANLHCIRQFREVLVSKSHLFPDHVREGCLSVLKDMQQSAHVYLLTPVHADLKSLYRKLSSDWLKGSQFKKLLSNIEQKSHNLQGLAQNSHQDLMGHFHLNVTAEYAKRLLRGDVKLKDPTKQQEAYNSVKRDAESLHESFCKMGSREDWLKDVLIRIAELLKLQDLAAIQMHVASMALTYPDIRVFKSHKTNHAQPCPHSTERSQSENRQECVSSASEETPRRRFPLKLFFSILFSLLFLVFSHTCHGHLTKLNVRNVAQNSFTRLLSTEADKMPNYAQLFNGARISRSSETHQPSEEKEICCGSTRKNCL